MQTLKEGNFKNKTVLVRCDFNVSIDKHGEITDDFRIAKALPTIKFLYESGAVVVLMSHLEKDGKLLSLRPVAARLEKLLGRQVKFLNDCAGDKTAEEVRKLRPGEIVLLENLRFNPGEKNNNGDFAKKIAQMGDCYVNDAFSSCHRRHASIVGVPRYLPSFAGCQLAREIAALQKILENPARPFTVIIGGVKADVKCRALANIAKNADHILVGSKIGAMLLAHKQQMAAHIPIPTDSVIGKINLTDPKLHLPVDGVLALKDISEGYSRVAAVGAMRREENIYDIGPETAKFFAEIIKDSKTIFFAGPMGMFERKEFSHGTSALLAAIARAHNAFRVAGGGQTLEAIRKYNAQNYFDFMSTGGSALLEYVAGAVLPGIAALGKTEKETSPSVLPPKPKRK